MKKLLFLFLPLLVLAACTSEYDKAINGVDRAARPIDDDDVVFYATIEGSGTGAQTKVYADEDLLVLWNAGDLISIFNKETVNLPYGFKGEDGDNAGGFSKASQNNGNSTGNSLNYIYSLYPYDEGTQISNQGVISFNLPALQHYKANSFGLGANTMVSVTRDNFLQFKNAGSYLDFRFYGEDVSVKRITLQGNNGEKLAGNTAITMTVDGTPTVEMQSDAISKITLTCDTPVELGSNENNCVDFWFVVPPTTFSNGFTVTITDDQGRSFTKSSSAAVTLERNQLKRMAPVRVEMAYAVSEAVDLGLSVKWAAFNVGASSPEEDGNYYAWGETSPKENYSWETYKWCEGSYNTITKYNAKSGYGTVDNKTVLEKTDDAATANWGNNWRMPGEAECIELRTECEWRWTVQDGKNGCLVTGPNGNSIFLPATGRMEGTTLVDGGYAGSYWTSSLSEYMYARYLHFLTWDSSSTVITDIEVLGGRSCGLTVRPVFDDSPASGIALDKNDVNLAIGGTKQLIATLTPADASNKSVVWSSTDRDVASVSSDGIVRAVSAGTATITASTVNGFCATCKVTVVQPEYVDLGLSINWATFNVGASSPEDYGDYFAWGETEGKKAYSWETYKWCEGSQNTLTKYNSESDYGAIDYKTCLEMSDDAVSANWGIWWRMPTDAELDELRTQCDWQWTTQGGKNGYLVTGPNGNSIFLPAAGSRSDSQLISPGSRGYYWSSSLVSSDPDCANVVDFEAEGVNRGHDGRYCGHTIRPVYGNFISVSSVSLDRTHLSLFVDESLQLTATVLPVNALEKSVKWISNNPSVASVSSNGLVTANQVGNAVITVTTINGGFEATCEVTVKTQTPPQYVDLGLSVKWATFNVGATSPEDYGRYFAWGETTEKEDYSYETYKWVGPAKYIYGYGGNADNLSRLELSDDAAQANWGGNWRMPTADEMTELRTQCKWQRSYKNGKVGFQITGPNGNSIFLPTAGYRDGTDLNDAESHGYYWTSSLVREDDDYAVYSNVNPAYSAYATFEESNYYRFAGLSVRPVYDDRPTVPVPQAVDLGLSVKWASFNIGARSPEDYGDYFSWGEITTKIEYEWWSLYKWYDNNNLTLTKYNTQSDHGTIDNKTILELSDDAAQANWGENWRMPTADEMTELITQCNWLWTTQKGRNGYKVTGPNGNSIFLPAAGYQRYYSPNNTGSSGLYWSSSLNTDSPISAFEVGFSANSSGLNSYTRFYGLSIRPVFPIPVSGVSLDQTEITLYVGKSAQLEATALPANATEKGVTWSSDDPSVATVSTDGLVTAKQLGNAVITATTVDGGYKATCLVTVSTHQKEYVDLGLPSGVKWAACNVGAENPDDYGNYFAWGETESKSEYTWVNYKFRISGNYSDNVTFSKYNTKSEHGTVDNKVVLDLSDDAARANWGDNWYIPTKTEWEELMTECTWTWTTQDGKSGHLVTGPNGNSIFLPAVGSYSGSDGSDGCYWSSNLYTDYPYSAYYVYFDSEGVFGGRLNRTDRAAGFAIRPVFDDRPAVPQAVDLGLSVKWAPFNVGARGPEDYGDYFCWGETTPNYDYSWSRYKWCNGSENTLTKYNTKSSYGTVDDKTVLDLSDDAARANWGGNWRMPTAEEWKELITKCTWTWTTQKGRYGYIVTGPNGNSIFLLAAGYRTGSDYLDQAGSYGYYWYPSINTDYPSCAYSMHFDSQRISEGSDRDRLIRMFGFSIRPVSE